MKLQVIQYLRTLLNQTTDVKDRLSTKFDDCLEIRLYLFDCYIQRTNSAVYLEPYPTYMI